MWTWPTDLPRSEAAEALVSRVRQDQNVKGLILTGSWARGMATPHSDLDIYVLLGEPDEAWQTTWSADLDVPVVSVNQLGRVPENPNEWWDRYSFTHSRVLLDRMGGEVQRLATIWGTLTAAESRRAIETFLDGYINFAYRSLKSHRDGRPTEAHLDATESIPWALPVVFAVHRRVRPYNKYLPWEVVHHPFGDHRLDNGRLLSLLNTIVATGDAEAQRHLFAVIEEDVRRLGFGNVVDAWGDELSLFRSP
jgi:predicted nucleotidyltransferase